MKENVFYKIFRLSFKGRITRMQYFYSTVFIVGFGGLIAWSNLVHRTAYELGVEGERGAIFAIGTFFFAVISYLFLKASALRLHDMNYSGAYALFMNVFLVLAYVIVCVYVPQNEKNEYGEAPANSWLDQGLFAVAVMVAGYGLLLWHQSYEAAMVARLH